LLTRLQDTIHRLCGRVAIPPREQAWLGILFTAERRMRLLCSE
jgi:hypothetical protein